MPRIRLAAMFALCAAAPVILKAQTSGEEARALAVADSVLAAITRGDFVGMTDLMLDDAVTVASRTRDGTFSHRVQSRAAQRAMRMTGIVERGYSPEVRVQGPIAMVWYPYDLYVNGKWSHCGVDVFTLLKHDGRWRIASLVYSAEQPPVCSPHPAGPPRQ